MGGGECAAVHLTKYRHTHTQSKVPHPSPITFVFMFVIIVRNGSLFNQTKRHAAFWDDCTPPALTDEQAGRLEGRVTIFLLPAHVWHSCQPTPAPPPECLMLSCQEIVHGDLGALQSWE